MCLMRTQTLWVFTLAVPLFWTILHKFHGLGHTVGWAVPPVFWLIHSQLLLLEGIYELTHLKYSSSLNVKIWVPVKKHVPKWFIDNMSISILSHSHVLINKRVIRSKIVITTLNAPKSQFCDLNFLLLIGIPHPSLII